MPDETPHEAPRRSSSRLTHRGRVTLIVAGILAAAAAAVAVPLMLPEDDGGRPDTVTVPEGWRSGQVYAAVDKALELPAGTTEKAVPKAHLKLPGEADGNPEGYLFPATYPVDDKSTPQSLLSYMVNTATQKFGGSRPAAGADRAAVNSYQTITVASIVQAEADNGEDMGKVARVIYNRIEQGMPLQMDSTINYALDRSTLDTSAKDTELDNPYNTYARKGLPPSPIGNPGEAALKAAVEPTRGDWLYFVTVKPGDTRFTADYAEQRRNVAEFNKIQEERKKSG
ncbi:endolytic transglycosylase MltG [Streptomyces sp. NPDC049813]|uniref:endolytic transglycosylase MltG n=1 Tax=Streptomyces sp. NPDC049813 TaxID=3365597 RepID=UPI0037B4C57B